MYISGILLTADVVMLIDSAEEVEPGAAILGLDPAAVAVAGVLADGGCKSKGELQICSTATGK